MNARKAFTNILKFLMFLGVGLLLLWLVYRDQNFEKISLVIENVNFTWIWLSLIASLLSHVSRAYRWNILIEPLGYKPRVANTFFAVMVMYLANLAIPRLGEVSRCGIMKKYEKVPFVQGFGTVFIERLVDLLLLSILLAIVIITQYDEMLSFVNNNPQISNKVAAILTTTNMIIAGIAMLVCLVVLLVLREKLRHTQIYKKIKYLIINFWHGMKTIKNMERKFAFWFLSVSIYFMYFLMIYLCFFSFEATEHLNPLQGMAVFVIASFGMVAPVSGGIGAWHFMAIGTLYVYQIPEIEAKAFALITHGAMTLLLLVVGFLSLIAIPIYNQNRKKQEQI